MNTDRKSYRFFDQFILSVLGATTSPQFQVEKEYITGREAKKPGLDQGFTLPVACDLIGDVYVGFGEKI